MTYTVSVSGLRKAYGDRVVLDGIDLSVERGSVFALLGPNGAGKTTTVNILSTLVRPDAGSATIAGHDLATDPDGVRRSISLTGQFAAVDEILTAEENLLMMARLLRLDAKAARTRTRELLSEFDLEDVRDRRLKALSGGMRRRVDIAASVIVRPRLLFLDEPTTGLDPRSREQAWATVRKLTAEGVTILLTTQYLEEADQLADRIAMLGGGRIVAEGTADELKSSLEGEVVRLEFADADTFERAARTVAASDADSGRCTLDVATDGSADEVRNLLSNLDTAAIPVQRVSLFRPSLDDVFLSLTEKPKEVAR
ncbi:MAG: ATP-binding cassette domain-containing protein [Actinomycetia bacterium]|nr:ATP-binding cassette domain-containing protein [Actinomycetes bacterium]